MSADGENLSDIVNVTVYDSNYRPVSVTDANGNTTTMTYDMLGRLLSVTYPDSTLETYSYDIKNNITTYTAANGTVYKNYSDAWGSRVKTTAVINGAETQFDEYSYNDLGCISAYRRFTAADEYTEACYTYDDFKRVKSEKVYDSSNNLVRNMSFEYRNFSGSDSRPNHSVTCTLSGDGGTYANYVQTTDYRGNVIKKSYTSGTDERTYSYTYDCVGNPVTETDPSGTVTSTEYDIFNNPVKITYADGFEENMTYNALDLVTQKTDRMGYAYEYLYDNAGRLIEASSPFNDGGSSKTRYTYDGSGNITVKGERRGANGSTNYDKTMYFYDSMNRPTGSAQTPDENEWIYTLCSYNSAGLPVSIQYGAAAASSANPGAASGGRTLGCEYDALGRKTKETLPDGTQISYEYDLQGRLLKKTYGSTPPETYTYDAFGNLTSKQCSDESVSYAYNLLGKRTSMTDSTGTTTYTYSPFGELTAETKGSIIKSYTYDAMGNKTSFCASDNGNVITSNTYTYDTLNRLASVTNGADVVTYAYDANSNRLSTSVNGAVTSTAAYNKAGMPVEIKNYSGGQLADTTQYVYDYKGNMRSSVCDKPGEGCTFRYSYDYMDRLKKEITVKNNAIDSEDSYIYDSFGNRTEMTHFGYSAGGETFRTVYAYDSNNSINLFRTDFYSQNVIDDEYYINFEYESYCKDAKGNIVSVMSFNPDISEITYDAFGRPVQLLAQNKTITYIYDGDNLRQSKTVDGVTTAHILDGADVAADISGSETTEYVRGHGLELVKKGAETGIYSKSAKGDITAVTTTSGTGRYAYYAYGTKAYEDEVSINPFEYCGEYFDSETGLVYLRNRYYNPKTGRFLTQDPARDGFNWYAYCENNPVSRIDPLGLFDVDTIYAYNSPYNIEIEILQNELKYLGYYNGNIDGLYGIDTKTAVKDYQKSNELIDDGIVGIDTWSSMGLIYRTEQDINAGIEIATVGLKQYKDVSVPINTALVNATASFKDHKNNFKWFYDQVKTGGPWDIKLEDNWNKTIAAGTYPGSYSKQVMLYGTITTPEALGNITYGYLGTAAGFSQSILLQGGDAAANGVKLTLKGIYNGVKGIIISADSQEDKYNIIKGINLYKK